MKILLVDDDADLSDMVAFALRRHGHTIVQANDGESALQLWLKENPDLILLDVRLPRKSGWAVCSEIRGQSAVPIVMLTAAGDEDDVVRGLDLGADDYVLKPVRPRELLARIRAVQRRVREAGPWDDTNLLAAGDLQVNGQSREAIVDKRAIRLTPLEFRILRELMRQEGRVVTYEMLTEQAWGYAGIRDSGMLKSHIRHLREKLETDPGHPSRIITVPGAGYTFQSISVDLDANEAA